VPLVLLNLLPIPNLLVSQNSGDPPAAAAAVAVWVGRELMNTHALPMTQNVRALMTMIRDKETDTADFVFYSDRLMRILVEYGLSFLLCTRACAHPAYAAATKSTATVAKSVTTPCGT
jgi:hypothetical protein